MIQVQEKILFVETQTVVYHIHKKTEKWFDYGEQVAT